MHPFKLMLWLLVFTSHISTAEVASNPDISGYYQLDTAASDNLTAVLQRRDKSRMGSAPPANNTMDSPVAKQQKQWRSQQATALFLATETLHIEQHKTYIVLSDGAQQRRQIYTDARDYSVSLSQLQQQNPAIVTYGGWEQGTLMLEHFHDQGYELQERFQLAADGSLQRFLRLKVPGNPEPITANQIWRPGDPAQSPSGPAESQ